jgi:hypothetical protein
MFTDNIEEPYKRIKTECKLDQIPGLHIRTIQHHAQIDGHVSFEDYMQKYIDQLKDDEKTIYVASHIQRPIDYLKEKGFTVICTDQERSKDLNDDWTEHFKEVSKEYSEVLLDTLLLGSCKRIVGGRSNVLFAASWMNPDIPITLLDFDNSQNSEYKGYGVGGIR